MKDRRNEAKNVTDILASTWNTTKTKVEVVKPFNIFSENPSAQ